MSGFVHDDPWETLQVPRTASDDEIKKAYRRLALKYHPDKPGGSEYMFQKVNAAYQILKNRPPSEELSEDVFKMVKDFFQAYASAQQRRQQASSPQPKRVITLKVDVTLDDLYHHKLKKMIIKVNRYVEQEACFKQVSNIIYLSLLNFEKTYLYKDQGDDYHDEAGQVVRGDILIKVNVKEHPRVKQDTILYKYDLYIEEDMSLYEYYYGVDRYIALLEEDDIVQVQHPPPLVEVLMHVVEGKGLPYVNEETGEEKSGDMYIYLRLKLPKEAPCEKFLRTYFK